MAEDFDGKIVGYVLGKLDDDEQKEDLYGHITSISVKSSHRKLGIATKLMRATEYAMRTVYGARYCSLHVRESNRAAIGLYSGVLGFQNVKLEKSYYADGEDAYYMKLDLTTLKTFRDVPEQQAEESKAELKAVEGGETTATEDEEEKKDKKKKKKKKK